MTKEELAYVGVAMQEMANSYELLGRLLTGEQLILDKARIPDMLERAAQRLRRLFKADEAPLGSRLNPGNYDCLNELLPDEPFLVVSARDLKFAATLTFWSNEREADIIAGLQPPEDISKVNNVREMAVIGARWREYRLGAWRK